MGWWYRLGYGLAAAARSLAAGWRHTRASVDVTRLTRTRVNREAYRRQVEWAVNNLAPDGVDEVTGHFVDNLINAWADQWESQVDEEYARYWPELVADLGPTSARLARFALWRTHRRRRLSDVTVAYEAAQSNLLGDTEPVGRTTTAGPPEEPVVRADGHGDDTVSLDVSGRLAEEPAVHRRPDHWSPGYQDPTLMAGRPRGDWLHVPILLLVLGADFGAFYQVVLVVMRADRWMLLLVVSGFAAAAVYLAHTAGTMLRDRAAGISWVRGGVAWLCIFVWLALGGCAFWVRALDRPTTGAETQITFADPASSPPPALSSGTDALLPAFMFAALYLATGLVAGVGAYLTRNPLRARYATAHRAHRTATRRAARTAKNYRLAAGDWMTQLARIQGVNALLREEREQRRQLADELKQLARHMIAQRGQEAALTDALFEPDRRPYLHGASDDRHDDPPAAVRTSQPDPDSDSGGPQR